MNKCPKCGKNDFQVEIKYVADARFNEEESLLIDQDVNDESLCSVQCAKCGHTFKNNKDGSWNFYWSFK